MAEMTLDQAMAEGTRLEQGGQWEQAEQLYRAIATQLPQYDRAMGRLAFLAQRAGRFDEALQWLHRAVQLKPNEVDYLGNLGVVLARLRRFEESAATFERAIAIDPRDANLHVNFGNVLGELKQRERAVEAFGAALRINPNIAAAHFNLGNILWEIGRYPEATHALLNAIALRPDFAEANLSLGSALRYQGKMDEAERAFRRSIELRPDLGEAFNGLAGVYQAAARVNDALHCYRRAAQLTDRSGVTDILLVTLHLDPASDPKSLYDEHAAWNNRYARPLAASIEPHKNDPSPDRRIRVGFVSAYLSGRPVGRFLSPLMANRDRQSLEVFCYSDLRTGDDTTARLQALSDAWRDTEGMEDDQLARQIREDQIDVLIDLGMHTRGNRMLTFARKPAPVQVTYLAYCSTTGLQTIDYRISDPFLDPTDADQPFYSEKTVRLSSYWCYPPPESAPHVSDLPAFQKGYVTFGCLNDFSKVSDVSLAMWGQIMRQTPESRLVIHSMEGSHRNRVLATLAECDVAPARVQFVGMQAGPQYFATYGEIDVALDPTPWCGGTTTCDALWMGVPVVTLAGRTAISRGGASILGQLAQSEWVARDRDAYIRIAVGLAQDLPRLQQLRATLRDRMQVCRLMDGPAFAKDFENALRAMWRHWCQTGKMALPDRPL